MSESETANYAETISAVHRRAELVEILSEALCRLAGISVNSSRSPGTRSTSAR